VVMAERGWEGLESGLKDGISLENGNDTLDGEKI